jgi:hypothetical protein
LQLVSARYDLSGRPLQNCGAFDPQDPVRKFTFTLLITNETGAALDRTQWGAAALAGSRRAFQLCYFKTEGPALPDLPVGQTRRVTLSAFVEPNQNVTAILIGDHTGNTSRLCIKDTRAAPCP